MGSNSRYNHRSTSKINGFHRAVQVVDDLYPSLCCFSFATVFLSVRWIGLSEDVLPKKQMAKLSIIIFRWFQYLIIVYNSLVLPKNPQGIPIPHHFPNPRLHHIFEQLADAVTYNACSPVWKMVGHQVTFSGKVDGQMWFITFPSWDVVGIHGNDGIFAD